MEDFRAIAQRIADDIRSGALQAGDRLPPQRVFAYNRGIAASTAGRVYAELRRRGLVSGEIGRGTFVRNAWSNPAAYHLLLKLPGQIRAETFVAMAARENIAVIHAEAFAVLPAHAPNAVRIGLANLDLPGLACALAALAALAGAVKT